MTMTTTDSRGLGARLRKGFTDARWFWNGVTGADAYERYVAHHARHHPGEEPMSAKDFWREKYADMERNPKSRCC